MLLRTTVVRGGGSATGLLIPDEIVASLGAGKRPPVRVTIGGHAYRSTVASMGGRFLVPLSAEHRTAAGVAADDAVDVEIELDEAPREVAVPADLSQALAASEPAGSFFAGLPYSHRKEWVRWIEEAKQSQTRQSRISRAIELLSEGRPRH